MDVEQPGLQHLWTFPSSAGHRGWEGGPGACAGSRAALGKLLGQFRACGKLEPSTGSSTHDLGVSHEQAMGMLLGLSVEPGFQEFRISASPSGVVGAGSGSSQPRVFLQSPAGHELMVEGTELGHPAASDGAPGNLQHLQGWRIPPSPPGSALGYPKHQTRLVWAAVPSWVSLGKALPPPWGCSQHRPPSSALNPTSIT